MTRLLEVRPDHPLPFADVQLQSSNLDEKTNRTGLQLGHLHGSPTSRRVKAASVKHHCLAGGRNRTSLSIRRLIVCAQLLGTRPPSSARSDTRLLRRGMWFLPM